MEPIEKAYLFFKKYPGHLKTLTADIAERLNVSEQAVTAGRAKYRDSKDNNRTTNANDRTKQKIENASDDISDSYQEFLEKHGIDEEDVSNAWFKQQSSGTYFSVETRKNTENDPDFDPEIAFKEAISEYSIPDYTPKLDKVNSSTENLAVINLYDAHLDKICSLAETDQNTTIKQNVENFNKAFNELLSTVASKNPEKIIIPVGNDFWQTNDHNLTTKRGTDQKHTIGMNEQDSFKLGVNLIRASIDKARKIADEVIIIPVKGNHDEDRVAYLTRCLVFAFENQEDVTIIDNRRQRNYYRYGSYLFGFAHGNDERKAKDLPMRMASDKDSRKHWSEIDKAIFFLGDIHHQKKYKFMQSQDFQGCEVKFLRTMGTTDKWHWSKGYTGIPRTAYAFVYPKDGTRTQEFQVHL